MNTLLCALQIILTIKLFTVTFNHGLRPDPVKMQRGKDRLGRMAKPVLILVAALTFFTTANTDPPVRPVTQPGNAGVTTTPRGCCIACRVLVMAGDCFNPSCSENSLEKQTIAPRPARLLHRLPTCAGRVV